MDLYQSPPVVFAAQSKQFFYCRDAVCAYVFAQGRVPLHPFRVFDYFLCDRVERDQVRQANFTLLRRSDELWVFGEKIADGVLLEIRHAMQLEKPIRFFGIATRPEEIRPLTLEELDRLSCEEELASQLYPIVRWAVLDDIRVYLKKRKDA